MDRGPEGFGPSRAEAEATWKGPVVGSWVGSSSRIQGYGLILHHLCILGNIREVSALSVEALKAVEIEKCKSDIKKMKEELAARGTRWVCAGWAGKGGPC